MAKKRKAKVGLPMDGVVLDLETTGLTPNEGARIIEIGAVKLQRLKVVDEFHILVNPGVELPAIVSRITGLNNEDLVNAATPEQAIPQLLRFIGRLPVIAHNAAIERDFLSSECQCIGQLPPEIEYHCTLRLSRRFVNNAPNCKLETLANALNLPCPDGFHRALQDARVTAHLWLHLRRLYEQHQRNLESRWD